MTVLRIHLPSSAVEVALEAAAASDPACGPPFTIVSGARECDAVE